VNNDSRHEKSNVIERCLSDRGADAGFLRSRAGSHYYYNASNDSYYDCPATNARFAEHDHNNAHGQRVLRRLIAALGAMVPIEAAQA
jgi:hypothetical protein